MYQLVEFKLVQTDCQSWSWKVMSEEEVINIINTLKQGNSF